MRTIEEELAEQGFTRDLRPEHRALIAGCGSLRAFPAGSTIFRAGDPADTFYLLRSGRVALEVYGPSRGALTVETLGPGQVLGWSWLFEPYRCSFDARVVSDARTIAFDGACLRGKAEADHELGYQLMRRMARVFTQRLEATRLQLLDVYGDHAAR
ncbi:MAG: cyclic nucleotide-binding domain-containing protein [Planctomycetota bacterium]